MQTRRTFTLLTLVLICLLQRGQTFAAQALPRPSTRFGAVESYYRSQDAAKIGIGWDRVIFEWRNFQPTGPTDFITSSIPTAWLEDAQRSGRQIVGLIKNAPRWATLKHQLGAVPLGLERPIDDPQNYWAQFVSRLTRYYGSRWGIHRWIIYNEPDIRPEDTNIYEFLGEVEDYYLLLKTAYKAAKAADPDALIHLAGMSTFYDQQKGRRWYLERLVQIAKADPEGRANGLFFDVLTVHVYNFTQYVWTLTNQLSGIMERAGYPKPIWIDELNARPSQDDKLINIRLNSGGWSISLDDQAAFLVQAAANGLALNAEGILIYRLWDNVAPVDGESWGLIRHDGTKRPGYDALGLIIREFSDTLSTRRVSLNGVRIIRLQQKDRVVTVLWNASSNNLRIRTPVVADAELLSPVGKHVTMPHVDGYHEFTLPRCAAGCFIEGEPRILLQSGAEPKLYLVVDGGLAPLD
jgi:hypothetical protein